MSPTSLARASARRPWIVILAWLLLMVGAALSATNLGSALTAEEMAFLNSPESARGARIASDAMGETEGQGETVIVRSSSAEVEDPEFRRIAEQLISELEQLEETVGTVTSYYAVADLAPEAAHGLVSASGRTLLVPVTLIGEPEEFVDAIDGFRVEGFEVLSLGSASTESELVQTAERDLITAELYGLPITLVVLLGVFGALVAAGVSMALAAVAILTAVGATALVGNFFSLSFFVVNMITMIGLAVGIDYALFIIERYREERGRGLTTHDAIVMAGGTASKAVLFSGGTVILALFGLFLVPITTFRSLGTGAVLVVGAAVLAMLTLVPALLALLGDRINWPGRLMLLRGRGETGPVAHGGHTVYEGFWGRVTRAVTVRPILSVVLAAGVLLLAAVPNLQLERGAAGAEGLPPGDARQAHEVMTEEFSPRPEPLEVVVNAGRSPEIEAAVSDLADRVAADPLFAGAPEISWSPEGGPAVLTVALLEDVTSNSFPEVDRLRDVLIPTAFEGTGAEVLVTGEPALEADAVRMIGDYTPWVFAFVLGLSFLLLLLLFRSVVVPAKAIAMNLLSVGAAYGILVLVFQKGFGADLLGFQRSPVIESWVPLFLFCILFGLSMDYHVFLLSRIREHFDKTGHNVESVAVGLRSTGRIITGAALIMVVVFSTFASGNLIMMQQVGFGLAVAIFLDATIVRSVLVPSGMVLLGRLNWYLPKWLRRLPDLRIEGRPPEG